MKNKIAFVCAKCGNPLETTLSIVDSSMVCANQGDALVAVVPCECCILREKMRGRRVFNLAAEFLADAEDIDAAETQLIALKGKGVTP